MVRMRIAQLDFDRWVRVSAVPMQLPSSRVLLGRSFLRDYWLTCHGPEESFHFSFAPSSYEELDG
jgi:hypothetical protein